MDKAMRDVDKLLQMVRAGTGLHETIGSKKRLMFVRCNFLLPSTHLRPTRTA